MSTFRNIREVYETANGIADMLRNEREHVDPVDVEEWYSESVCEAADRECIYTQDNWDVCNIMRCSDEMYTAEDLAPMSEYEGPDSYMMALAFHIWEQLIREALNKEA